MKTENQFDVIVKTFTKKDFLIKRVLENQLSFWNGHSLLTVEFDKSSGWLLVKLSVNNEFNSGKYFSKSEDIDLDTIFNHLMVDVIRKIKMQRDYCNGLTKILKTELLS